MSAEVGVSAGEVSASAAMSAETELLQRRSFCRGSFSVGCVTTDKNVETSAEEVTDKRVEASEEKEKKV